MKNNYEKKLEGCKKLVEMKVKKVGENEVKQVAKELGLRPTTMQLAWNNFQQTGGKYIDRAATTGGGSLYFTPTVTATYMKINKEISPAKAGMILREYMTTDIKSRELCNKYEMPLNQFYGYIQELNVKGTLMGFKVLDPKKYAKVEVKDVIWLRKNPDTKRKSILALTDMEKVAYERVADVLMDYLPKERNK